MKAEKGTVEIPPKFKFLDDSCSGVDLTEDKTHQRIADQLFDLIESGDSKGLTIGLEGDWGSGKSTVIELLRKKLEPRKKPENFLVRWFCRKRKKENKSRTVFFYIDAWEHEGDPLRRAFLEALIDKLEKLLAEQQHVLFRKTRKELRRIREKVSGKIATTRLTGLGLMMAAAGLLVPIGAELVSTYASQVTLRNTGKPCWGFITGVALCLAPAIAFVLAKGLQWIFPHRGKQSSALFSTEKSMDISFENERTSLELSKYFNEILDTIKNDFDQVVMVIDNLDRIGQEDALRIWSTLQTFVQRKNPLSEQKEGIPKWVVVPYAEEGLGRIWNNELEATKESKKSAKGKGLEQNQEVCDLNGERRGAKRLASFMDKTFDLRIHVPNMLLGDWQAFAKSSILQVEPRFSSDDVGTILNALVWTRKRLEDAPSPRQIKLYVNHVALLCQLHRVRVSLDAICFYVITKYLGEGLTDEDIKNALLSGGINDRSLPGYSGPLASEMAAIVFNSDKKRAMRLLLETTLREKLEAKEIEALQISKERFGDVFDDVIGHILIHVADDDFSEFLALIQRACSGLSERLRRYAFQRMKTEREAIIREISSLGQANALALIDIASQDQELSNELVKKYVSDEIYKFGNSRNIFSDLYAKHPEIPLGTYLLKRMANAQEAAKQNIKIPYQELIDRKFAFDKLDRKEMEQFVAYVSDLEAADKHLSDILVSPWEHWPKRMSEWFGVLTAHGLTRIESIVQALETILHGNVNLLQTDAKDAILEMLVALESIPHSKRPLERIRKMLLFIGNRVSPNEQNGCLHFLLAKYQENDPANTGAMEARFTHVRDSYQKFMNREDAETGEKIYRYTALSEEREWLARMVARPNRRLGGQIVKAALKANDPYLFRVPGPYAFASNVLQVLKGEDRTKLVDSFMSDPDRLTALSEPNGERLTGSAMLCRELLSKCQDAALRGKLMDRCVSEFRKKKPDEWKASFASGVPELFAWLEQNGVSLDLGTGFSKFFQQYLFDILPKERVDRSSFEELSLLYRSMNAAGRTQFAEFAGSRLLDRRMKVPPGERRRFLVEIPDYSGWFQKAQAEIGRQAQGLVEPQGLEKLEVLSEIMSRQQNRGSWWDAIRGPLAQPLKHLADLQNPHIKKVVQRIEGNLELIERTDNSGKDTDDHAGGEELWAQSGREKGGSPE